MAGIFAAKGRVLARISKGIILRATAPPSAMLADIPALLPGAAERDRGTSLQELVCDPQQLRGIAWRYLGAGDVARFREAWTAAANGRLGGVDLLVSLALRGVERENVDGNGWRALDRGEVTA